MTDRSGEVIYGEKIIYTVHHFPLRQQLQSKTERAFVCNPIYPGKHCVFAKLTMAKECKLLQNKLSVYSGPELPLYRKLTKLKMFHHFCLCLAVWRCFLIPLCDLVLYSNTLVCHCLTAGVFLLKNNGSCPPLGFCVSISLMLLGICVSETLQYCFILCVSERAGLYLCVTRALFLRRVQTTLLWEICEHPVEIHWDLNASWTACKCSVWDGYAFKLDNHLKWYSFKAAVSNVSSSG